MNLLKSRSLSLVLLGSLGTLSIAADRAGTDRVIEKVKAQALINYGKLPLSFEENRGQSDARVKFLSHGSDYSILLTPAEIFLNLQSKGKETKQSSMRMSFPGAQPSPAITASEREQGVSSYFIGKDASKWVTGAANFARVQYRGLYPGVDLAFYGSQGHLEYDFVVAPGANPKAIQLQFDGVAGMHLDAAGDLVLSSATGEVRQHKPVIYQDGPGGRQAVAGKYVLEANNRVAFEIARYDRSETLVIDPALTFATYLGSNGTDVFGISEVASKATYPAVAADLQGNVYVTGFMGGNVANFPGPPVILTGTSGGGGTDVFVVKMNPTGTALLYSVVFGTGQSEDVPGGIAVDLVGNAYVTGRTNSANFPITSGVAQPSLNGTTNAFLTKVNATGTALVYSTYLGGSGNFYGNAVAVDGSGNAYVTGVAAQSGGTPFPVASPIWSSGSGFLTKFNSTATAFSYSTYLAAGIGYGVAVDSGGAAYVTGSTGTFTAPSPSQGYVLKINAAGTSGYGPNMYGSSGGTFQTIGFGIAVDTADNAYVAGMTNDPGFPQLLVAEQPTYGGGLSDGFALKLNSGGTLVYGTYIGGLGSNLLPERASGIGVDMQGNAYISGTTECIAFPTKNSVSGARNGSAAVLMKGTVSGSTSNWASTNLVGSFDQVDAMAFDSSGTLYAGTSAVNASGGGVYKQTSGSSTWTAATSGITSSTIDALAVDPNSSSTVYAAGGGHVFKTTNGGTSWSQLSQTTGTSAVLAVAKTSTSTVYLGSSLGLLYSTNGGSTFTAPTTPPAFPIYSIIVDPNNVNTAYAATLTGVYQTINAGVTWVAVNNGLPISPVSPPTVTVPVSSLAINGSTRTIYAATGNGLFYTTNAGANWTQAILGQIASTPLLVAVDTANNVYVAFQGAGIATGTSGGTQQTEWSTLTYNGLTQNQITALATPPTGSGAYAGIVAATTAFLTKLTSSGSLSSATCIGGSDNNLGQSVAVTPGGSVYLSGVTTATNFPVTHGAIQTTTTALYHPFAVGIAGDAGSSGAPTVVVTSPVNGTILDGTATFTGYALDAYSSAPTAISSVQVWLDGNYLTTATYGISDPSACTATPSAPGCPNVGFTYTFATSTLSAGTHTLTFYALDSNSPADIGSAGVQFTIKSGPAIPYDFNGGPGPDVIWQDQTSGLAQIWYLGGPQGVTLEGAANLTLTNPWRIVSVADFDGNGTPDVVWEDPASGEVQVWYLGGPGGNQIMGAINVAGPNTWRVATVTDFNADGHPDLLWQDQTSGLAQIWYMGGPQGNTFLSAVNLTLTNPWRIVGTADFNGDGHPDIMWQDPVSGSTQIWYMGGSQGNTFLSAVNVTQANSWHVVAMADFNLDGHPDLVWEDPVTGASQVWLMTGSQGTTVQQVLTLSGPNPWRIAGPN